MSAIGTKRTSLVAPQMSAFEGRADIVLEFWLRELSRPLPAARARKVLLQNLAGLFVRDLWHYFRPGRFVEIVHSPNKR